MTQLVFVTQLGEEETKVDEMRQRLEEAVDAALNREKVAEELKVAMGSVMEDLERGLVDSLTSNAGYDIAATAQDMFRAAVRAMLEGSTDLVRKHLRCDERGFTGRSTADFANRDSHPVIHGKLHEADPIRTRRLLVEAHRDLITSERILDLEDQVKSLVKQVNEKEREIEALRQRL